MEPHRDHRSATRLPAVPPIPTARAAVSQKEAAFPVQTPITEEPLMEQVRPMEAVNPGVTAVQRPCRKDGDPA